MQRSLAVVAKLGVIVYSITTLLLASVSAPVTFAVGNALPTDSAAPQAQSGVTVNSDASGSESVEPASSPGWFSRTWSNFVDWFLDITDLSALSTKSLTWTVTHVLLLVAGLILAIFGARTYSWAYRRPRYSMTFQNIVARAGGLALLVMAFII